MDPQQNQGRCAHAAYFNEYKKVIRIPQNLHGALIGPGGDGIRSIRQSHRVRVNFPDKNTYISEVEVAGSKANVEAAISELTKRVNELQLREKVHMKTTRTIIMAMKDESLKEYVRDLSMKYDAHIEVPRDWSGIGGLPTFTFITGSGAKLVECQKDLCELYMFIEKRKAERMKAEVEANGGAPSEEETKKMSPVEVLGRCMPAHFVERYFSAENQKRLKEVEEGKREWEPFFDNIF